MSELLPYAVPAGMALAAMLAIVVGFGLMLAWPRVLLFGFLACLLLIASSSSYGLEDASEANVFWVKGTRTFFFSFVEMGVFGAWIATLLRNAWAGDGPLALPLSKYYLGFAALLVGHFVVGLFQPEHLPLLDLSQRGFSNLLYQGMFVFVLVSTLKTERDLRWLAMLIVACLVGRHLFGLVRYVAFDGDPQNAYATLGSSHVRITFWDINDGLLAVFAALYLGWRALVGRDLSAAQRLLATAAALLAMAMPLLSARRTAQGGLLLALVALAALLPRGRRWVAGVTLVLALPVVVFALGQRAEDKTARLIDRVLIDVQASALKDPRRTRFHELRTAWQTLREQPWFGLGPSGRFRVTDHVGLEYHAGRYDYVHSGFGHVMLKTGMVGLVLFVGLLLAWLRHVWRVQATVQGPPRALLVAAVGTFAASLPNLAVGTPIPEIRTMLVMGLLLALPFAVARAAAAELAAPVRAPLWRAPVRA
jgi:O-antigen ligase